jgi:hypothetical protein
MSVGFSNVHHFTPSTLLRKGTCYLNSLSYMLIILEQSVTLYPFRFINLHLHDVTIKETGNVPSFLIVIAYVVYWYDTYS